jgi:hypothetical protein
MLVRALYLIDFHPLPTLLFALKLARRLQPMADALLDMANLDFLFFPPPLKGLAYAARGASSSWPHMLHASNLMKPKSFHIRATDIQPQKLLTCTCSSSMTTSC